MVRKLEVVVPFKHSDEIRNVLTMNRSIHHLTSRSCTTTDTFDHGIQVDSVLFSFMVVNKKTHEVIDLLTMYGVSSRFGTVCVSALTSAKPRVSTYNSSNCTRFRSTSFLKKKYNISDRLAYDEVYDKIDGGLHLTFDYLTLIFIGAVIAAIGLLTDSAVAVVASMLISPLMGPIVGMTFGAVVRDHHMLWQSFRNELIGVALCFFTGAMMGLIAAPIMDTPKSNQLAFGDNTQISSRGDWFALAWGAGIAAPSGLGVALGVSNDQVSALIGVAISAALLPPITNSGVCLASALIYALDPQYAADGEIVAKWLEVGYISMLLFVLNWILIFIFGILMFCVKKLHKSAGEQAKMEKLNQFYAMKDKLEEETNKTVVIPMNGNGNRNSKNGTNLGRNLGRNLKGSSSSRLKLTDSASVQSDPSPDDTNCGTPLLQNNAHTVNYSSTVIQNYYNVPRI